MVIAKAMTEPGPDCPQTDDDAAFIGSRIGMLVDVGKLEVRGDLEDWRFGEVRRAY